MVVTIAAQAVPGKEKARRPNLAILVKSHIGVPMEGALWRADEDGLTMASNKRLSKAMDESAEWQSIYEVFACWTGTMTGYEKPDQKLGKTIEYVDPETGIRYVFPVPEEHQGKKNVLLVAEHPDFTLETDGDTRIVRAEEVGAVSEFPAAPYYWYLGDAKYDIPTGEKVDSDDQAARYLWRIAKRVGLVARGYYDDWRGMLKRLVGLAYTPSVPLGVVMESVFKNEASGKLVTVRRMTCDDPRLAELRSATGTHLLLPPEKRQGESPAIGGTSVNLLRELVMGANANLAEISQVLKPEELKAIRRLLHTLERTL